MTTAQEPGGAGAGLPPCLAHLASAPPFAPLGERIARLERAGLTVALGGSGLLAALRLADRVRDWDLTTDASPERVRAALAGDALVAFGGDALHADRKLALEDGTLEIILGFAFHTPAGVVRIPTRVSERRDGVPLGSPEGWAVAYHLLGRPAKAEALFAHLGRRGADPAARALLLAQPLAPELAARLAALPTSRVT